MGLSFPASIANTVAAQAASIINFLTL